MSPSQDASFDHLEHGRNRTIRPALTTWRDQACVDLPATGTAMSGARNPSSGGRVTRRYQRCRWCHRIFTRLDHLQRHERSHTKQKPFRCEICLKSFGRHDVLLRHAAQTHGASCQGDMVSRPINRSTTFDQNDDSLPASLRAPSDLDPLLLLLLRPEVFSQLAGPENGLLQQSSGTSGYNNLLTSSETSIANGETSQQLVSRTPKPDNQDPGVAIPQLNLDNTQYSIQMKLNSDAYLNQILSQGTSNCSAQPSTVSILANPDPKSLLDGVDLRSLLDLYKTYFLPKVPFIHTPTLDFDRALQMKFPKPGAKAPSSWTASSFQRSVDKTLFLSMLSIGAATSLQPVLARKLYDETAKRIRSDIQSFRQRKGASPPLTLIQALMHHRMFGGSNGNSPLEGSSESPLSYLISLLGKAQLHKGKALSAIASKEPQDWDHQDWRAWVEAEEKKRTFYGCLWLTSATRTISKDAPCPNLDALELDLPCHEALWEAESLEAFQKLLPSHGQRASFQHAYSGLFQDQPSGTIEECDPKNQSPLADDAEFASPNEIHPATEKAEISNMSEFGLLSLIAGFSIDVWKWDLQLRSHSRSKQQRPDAVPRFLLALNRWKSNWRDMWQPVRDTCHNSSRYKLLVACIPIFDNIQLLLRMDISPDKDALQEQNYRAIGSSVSVRSLNGDHRSIRLKGGGRVVDLDGFDVSESLQKRDPSFQNSFSDTAAYAAEALEFSLQLGPWWNPGNMALELPLHCALAAFNFVHILCSWLVFIDSESLPVDDSSEDVAEMAKKRAQLVETCERLVRECHERFGGGAMDAPLGSLPKDLAFTMLQLFSGFYLRDCAWPILKHLGMAFQARAQVIIQDNINLNSNPSTSF